MERAPVPRGALPVWFVLEEFPALGHMRSIETAAGLMAGFEPGSQDKKMERRTWSPRARDVHHDWYVVDAEGKTLGRLATVIASTLRGKNKATFAPHMDMGDYVVVINADKIAVTGNKEKEKLYSRHSGYPGGLTQVSLRDMRQQHPERIIKFAVKGMLPKNALGEEQLKKLKVYAGPDVDDAAFEELCRDAADDAMQAELDKVKARFAAKLKAAEDKLKKEERELAEDEAEFKSRKGEEYAKHAETLLSLFGGRRKSLSSSLAKRRMAEKAKVDIEESEQAIADMQKSGAGFAGFATWLDMTPAHPDLFAMPDSTSFIQLPWKKDVAWVKQHAPDLSN